MKLSLEYSDGKISEAYINGERLRVEDSQKITGNTFKLGLIKTDDLPNNVEISPSDVVYSVTKIGPNEVRINVALSRSRKSWNGLFNIEHIMQKKADIINNKKNITLDHFEKDSYEDEISISYHSDMLLIDESPLTSYVFSYAEQLIQQLFEDATQQLKVDVVKEMMSGRK
ncbi:hypothetical protein MZM54_02860 [[Brevibacterium] frigoritolerans]|nr:hypothetical protein [Peribacillus frigoritolerans]